MPTIPREYFVARMIFDVHSFIVYNDFRDVSVGRTLKDKILELVFEFATVQLNEAIDDLPAMIIEDPYLECFQTAMSIITPICTILYNWYTRRLNENHRRLLEKTIRGLKRKIIFLHRRREEFNVEDDQDDNDEEYDDEFEDAIETA